MENTLRQIDIAKLATVTGGKKPSDAARNEDKNKGSVVPKNVEVAACKAGAALYGGAVGTLAGGPVGGLVGGAAGTFVGELACK